MLFAWAIVESESTDGWRWFIQTMIEKFHNPFAPSDDAILRYRQEVCWTVISGRCKGLLNVDDLFPDTTRAYCVWHLHRNIEKRFKKTTARFIWRLAKATSDAAVDRSFAEILKHSAEAHQYVKDLDPKIFIQRDIIANGGRRWGKISSGIAESQNSVIVKDRELSALYLLDAL